MPGTTDTGDFDEQDVAETFDETMTVGDETDGRDVLSDGLDLRRDTYDVITAVGDSDLTGDDDALDADEEEDEDLDEIGEVSEQQEIDDLTDANSDSDPLASDDIPDFTSDRDFADDDDVDGVSARSSEDVELVSLGDVDALGGETGMRVADLESENLSDSDLVELDYKEA